ncbi:MAG: hypothetical protein ACLVJ6_11250 [Merdibacter sp.]
MHPFIATLATQVIIYGACSLYFDMPPNNSQPIGGVRGFALLGQFKFAEKAFGTKFPGISILVPIALIVLVVIWFVLNKTVFGKTSTLSAATARLRSSLASMCSAPPWVSSSWPAACTACGRPGGREDRWRYK